TDLILAPSWQPNAEIPVGSCLECLVPPRQRGVALIALRLAVLPEGHRGRGAVRVVALGLPDHRLRHVRPHSVSVSPGGSGSPGPRPTSTNGLYPCGRCFKPLIVLGAIGKCTGRWTRTVVRRAAFGTSAYH